MSHNTNQYGIIGNDTQIYQRKNNNIDNSKDRRTVTARGCDGTNNPGGTRKPKNPLKGTRNPIPQDPDNPLKGIRYRLQNVTRSQWPRGLTVPT